MFGTLETTMHKNVHRTIFRTDIAHYKMKHKQMTEKIQAIDTCTNLVAHRMIQGTNTPPSICMIQYIIMQQTRHLQSIEYRHGMIESANAYILAKLYLQ